MTVDLSSLELSASISSSFRFWKVYCFARVKLDWHSCTMTLCPATRAALRKIVESLTRFKSEWRTEILINNPLDLAAELLDVSRSTAFNIMDEKTMKESLTGKRKRESSIPIEVADYCRRSQFRI